MSHTASRSVLGICIGAVLAAGMMGLAHAAETPQVTQQGAAQAQSPQQFQDPATAPPVSAAEMPDTLYALGAALANNLRDFGFSPQEMKQVQAAFMEVSSGNKPKVNVSQLMPRIQSLYIERQKLALTQEKAAGAAYLAKAAKEPGAVKLDSGIIMTTLHAGKGAKPADEDTVKVTFNGRLIDGTEFDSTQEQGGEPTVLPMNAMIPCWTQAIRHMQVGTRSRMVCPSDLAHGDAGALPKIKPGATLIYDVELLEIVKVQGNDKPEGKS